jgi:hypothetical protein
MTTLYFTALVVTYVVNAAYFATKFVAYSAARKTRSRDTSSAMPARCRS